MKFKLSLLLITMCLLNCANPNTPLYIGTYTNGDSEGIYQLLFNTETGVLSNKLLVAKTINPSFLTFSPDKKSIYAVKETDQGDVASFKVEENGTLTLLTTVSSHGAAPCHISVNEAGNKAVVSNYTGGNISIYPINKDGSLSAASQTFDHNTDKNSAHAHSAQFYKDQLFVADLGMNAVYQYKLTNGLYNQVSNAIIKTTGHPGPRHFSLSNDGQFIYIINESGSSITSVKKNR